MPNIETILVERCKKNDPKAQKELYDNYSKKLFPLCMRYCESRVEAEDVLQESFIKIFFNIKNYSGDGSFEGWVKKITFHCCIKNFHKKKLKFSDPDFLIENRFIENNPCENHDGDGVSNLSYQELLNSIDQLPLSKKMIFNLYVIEGYNHKEIANVLNISEGTSKSQLAKARELLQEYHRKNNSEYAKRVF